MNALLFALNGALVFVQLIVCYIIEGVLGIGRLIDCRIMLESSLYDALGGGTHQHNMITSLRDGCIFDAIRLIPGNALQNVRLWAGRNFVCASIVLNLFSIRLYSNVLYMNLLLLLTCCCTRLNSLVVVPAGTNCNGSSMRTGVEWVGEPSATHYYFKGYYVGFFSVFVLFFIWGSFNGVKQLKKKEKEICFRFKFQIFVKRNF